VNDKSLTPLEVADQLKITKNTVYEMIKRGELPAFRIGRKLRIDPRDVELFRTRGKRFEFAPQDAEPEGLALMTGGRTSQDRLEQTDKQPLIMCGHDILLDILARNMEQRLTPLKVYRYQVGSFSGLSALYQGNADMAAIHLWDGDTGQYNLSYVRHLLPGIPVVIIHLAKRMQGFYVRQGNPKQINDWKDLARTDVRICNREKGCGTRVLLDEKLRKEKIDRNTVIGYEHEEVSHLAVASAVARGDADVALGIEKASLQVRGIEFIPLQKERYELVVKKENIDLPKFQMILTILRSLQFRAELQGLGDYDLSETGNIVAEL